MTDLIFALTICHFLDLLFQTINSSVSQILSGSIWTASTGLKRGPDYWRFLVASARIKLTTFSFSVHVKLSYRIVLAHDNAHRCTVIWATRRLGDRRLGDNFFVINVKRRGARI